ncbi:hypothetical protein HMPREF9445_02793 [Bacteroides clarus YIT 12056]|uniref:Uncharacterized protein n=1 Tax=Bacteroides clarus YIT 12056 TaxID=762984 RepID=A0ABN0CJR7_9BACE|nr:hypothetical protein HMPREF9445_02793 [Bacteroides clarus YIT 12056]
MLLIYQIGQNHKCYEKVIYASGFLLLAVTLDSPVLFFFFLYLYKTRVQKYTKSLE